MSLAQLLQPARSFTHTFPALTRLVAAAIIVHRSHPSRLSLPCGPPQSTFRAACSACSPPHASCKAAYVQPLRLGCAGGGLIDFSLVLNGPKVLHYAGVLYHRPGQDHAIQALRRICHDCGQATHEFAIVTAVS